MHVSGISELGYDLLIYLVGKSISNEHKYIDVIVEGEERVIIWIDFRSEFEIARSTRNYRRLLEMVPTIFVGRSDRLLQIVDVMSEALKKSMKKEGLHIPPWRKSKYMRSKWVSPHQRLSPVEEQGTIVEAKQIWQPPPIQPKTPAGRGGKLKIFTGLSFILS